jgi:hypothetical protein
MNAKLDIKQIINLIEVRVKTFLKFYKNGYKEFKLCLDRTSINK